MTKFWSAYTYDEITEEETKVKTNKFLPQKAGKSTGGGRIASNL
jgi:hypothetical protein